MSAYFLSRSGGLRGGELAVFRKLSHLGGHHRKTLAVLPGTGGLDGGV